MEMLMQLWRPESELDGINSRNLNREDAMDLGRWKKLIQIG